ncbi:hypothetical protein BIY21_13970 [Vibrio ponticus]|uniref:Molecular chaperone n=1 Tax=Vibrio ponticus TaxID=265668 RepID=A0ABX3FDN7_9VIBR|nr:MULTISPECIES: molecular chaperone [Vibrio]OLQ90079.1 hypothetical protein BIY21_13970 [Vibrio ponticus]
MNNLALLPRALGALFYYSPVEQINLATLNNLESLASAYQWQDLETVNHLIISLKQERYSANKYNFSVLFEGQGEMLAPPWGSVYQNRENLVMGDSTAAYYQFLDRAGIAFEINNQPLDHFGLMMWALALLIEEGNQVALVEFLSVHLLPWSGRYLELLQSNQESPFYADLAKLTELFLEQVKTEIGLTIEPIKLYK